MNWLNKLKETTAIPAAEPFNPEHWQGEIKRLADEISSKDPGGDCWQCMKVNKPDLWKAHLSADMEIDKAYQEQEAGKISAAINRTRATFTAMIEAWKPVFIREISGDHHDD